jgi:hypothetical protein
VPVPREPPYPPPPRQVPAELDRKPGRPAAARIAVLAAQLFGVVLFAATPALALGAAFLCLHATGWFTAFRGLGFIVFFLLAVVYLKSLLPRRVGIEPAILPLQPDQQPTAQAFVARVADDVGAPAPRRLLVGPGVELQLGGKRSLADLLGKGHWDLHVGLWLWHCVTLSEFQALVARTLAPLGQGRFERHHFTVRRLLEAFVDGLDRIDEAGTRSNSTFAALARITRAVHFVTITPVRVIGRLLLRLGRGKTDAFANDLEAVRVAGSDALVHAILRADFAGATLREIDEALVLAVKEGVFTRDLFAHVADAATILREAHNDFTLGEPPFLRGPNAGKHSDVFEPGQRYLSAVWRALPGPSEREHAAKRSFVAAERDDRPAAELIDEPPPLREKLTRMWYVERRAGSDDLIPFPPEVVRQWLATGRDETLATKHAGCYDAGRRIQPGTSYERELALTTDTWDDARLLSTATGLYTNAGDRAARWRGARTALDRLLRKTMYRPAGRERAYSQDLEEDLRKMSKWLSALDRWVYVVHVHMAARLPDITLHDELLHRYESVLRLQPFAADAREYRNRVAAFAVRLGEYGGTAPYRLARDADREFDASRKDFVALLVEATGVDDPFLSDWTGGVRLDRFLYAHQELPGRGHSSAEEFGQRVLQAWTEVAAKALWLHRRSVTGLLDLHERILTEFKAMVGPLPPPLPPIVEQQKIPEAILLEPEPELLEPELVDDLPPVAPEEPPDDWLIK